MDKRVFNKILFSAVVLVLILAGGKALSQSLKTAQSGALSDDQQAILGVRTAKASVVDIVGITASIAPATSVASPTITVSALPSEVQGTGFVWESDGLIVSNNHVVEDPTMNYTVILADGTEYPAKVLYQDKFDDIAFLKIKAQNLVPAVLGDSSSLETGQSVFAIGDSLGQYQYSVTKGVISAVGRSVDTSSATGQADSRLLNLIQTDAAINPGNSGGPLINLTGQVVGMNTLIDTGGTGLGFAIPINTIKDAISQLNTFGKVSRPFLGIQFVTIDPATQLIQNLSVSNGALVANVLPNSPAAIAGVQMNDIVIAVNDIALNQNSFLDQALQNFQAGSQVTLTILRNGATLKLPVVLGQRQ